MSQPASSPAPAGHAAQAAPAQPPAAADLGRSVARSKAFAWCVLGGLPALGLLASVAAGLPLFAAFMACCFLLATALAGYRALATFTAQTLRLLVTARLVIVLVVAALLFGVSGHAWVGVISAVLLWLTADRLLGRRALYDLWKAVRKRQ
jgi:hypothetical protein